LHRGTSRRLAACYERGVTEEQALAVVLCVVTAGLGAVSVVAADDHGEVVASLRMDGAPLDTMLNAQRKAFTAARSDATTTRELAAKGEDAASFDPFFTFFLGGVAAFEHGKRVGAVGVSGLPGEVDEELAFAAIRAAGLESPPGH
jgi:glc operon protein GlcG